MATNDRESRRQRWRFALGLVLVFPIVAFLIAVAVDAKYQADLIAAVEQQVGPLTPEQRAQVTIAAACADPQLSGDPVCGDVTIAAATRVVAIASAVAGLFLIAFIAVCTRQAGRDREALLRLFRPGLYVTLVGAMVLVTADALLALASVYLGFAVFLGRILPIVLLAIALGGALGIIGMIRALIATTRRAEALVIGVRRTESDEPRLHGLIRDIARHLGADAPDNVLVGLDPSFFVTEADVEATDGRWRGRNLYLSLPLMRILEPSELRAVIGHELGHFRGRDSAFSQRFYPIYRGTGEAIDRLYAASTGGGAQALALLPAMVLLGLFYEGFATAERSVSRDRELAADTAGVEASSAHDLGSALMKLTAFAPLWGPTLEAVYAGAGTAKPVTNAGDRFIDLIRTAAIPAALRDVDAGRVPHPTDSHPVLSQRLGALGLSSEDLAAEALRVAPEPAADEVVADRERDETTLTAWVNRRIGVSSAAPEPAPATAG